MVASRESVTAKLQETYGVDEKTAHGLMEYDIIVRKSLNQLGQFAYTADTGAFEFKDGTASTVSGIVESGLGIIPYAGQAAAFLAHLATLGIKKLEEHSLKQDVENVTKMNPTEDLSDWASFTKDLSANLAAQRVSQIKGMNSEQITKLARQDAGKVTSVILDGKAKRIDDSKAIPELVLATTGRSIDSETAEQISQSRPGDKPSPSCRVTAAKTPFALHAHSGAAH